jgi:hypothetical protein
MKLGTTSLRILASILLVGCASGPKPKLFFDEKAAINQEIPFTITAENDNGATMGELQVRLQKSGFRLLSKVALKNTTTLNKESRFTEINSLDSDTTLKQQEFQQYGSSYRMTINYEGELEGNTVYYSHFFAEIADDRTGTILMTIQYPHGKYKQDELLDDLVKRMQLCAKEHACDEESQAKANPQNSGAGVFLAIVAIGTVVAITVAAQ